VARAIHAWSGRSGPFYAVNCAGLPAALADAELFGHVKGAFTSAERDNVGHFRAAHGGTLFLDEAAELSLDVQAKLLRALEDHKVTAVGSTRAVDVDVRIVTAFQREPSRLVTQGVLRDDLAARLVGLTVELPTLAERRADIAPLFRAFLRLHAGDRAPEVDGKLVESLLLYPWPHNVRELELLARRLLILYGLESVLRRGHLPKQLLAPVHAHEPEAPPGVDPDDDDRQRLAVALRTTNGNVKAAATLAGFSRQRAYRVLNGRSARELIQDFSAGQGASGDE
jgi:DNA-binding NtrC family response regulator